jgi:hypothetical protein
MNNTVGKFLKVENRSGKPTSTLYYRTYLTRTTSEPPSEAVAVNPTELLRKFKKAFRLPIVTILPRLDTFEAKSWVRMGICARVIVLALARRGRLLHPRMNVQAARVTSSLLALVCQVTRDRYCRRWHQLATAYVESPSIDLTGYPS